MPLDILIGTQWGDEGKGRIVDLLAARARLVARYNGGDNAGHTVTVGRQTYKLHLIPSGIIHRHTIGLLGCGMVINPAKLLSEMEMLHKAGVEVNPSRLQISHAAHLITPGHLALDKAMEKARRSGQLGTTGRGIGPAYTDKAARQGLRMQDMLNPAGFRSRLEAHLKRVNLLLNVIYREDPLDVQAVCDEYATFAAALGPYIKDVSLAVRAALEKGESVLAEGAQGTLLDLDLGTYPYVTSSSSTAAGALTGLGIGITPVERVIGITKAFQTRVGSGPFPTELQGETAERLRGSGSNPWDEFGTTTGRPRRVGWLDGVLLRYAVRVNGVTELAMTKLDILRGLPQLKLCVAYTSADGQTADLPLGPADLSPYRPVYEEMESWPDDLSGVRRWEDLPSAARAYILRVEELCSVAVRMISVGPERSQVIEIEP